MLLLAVRRWGCWQTSTCYGSMRTGRRWRSRRHQSRASEWLCALQFLQYAALALLSGSVHEALATLSDLHSTEHEQKYMGQMKQEAYMQACSSQLSIAANCKA